MFLKPYKVKSNSPLKGSETKRIRERIEKSFPSLTAEQLQTLFPAKASLSVLKVITHAGFQTNVYCVDKLPQFFEMEGDVLVPTLYALWQVPSILPYFTTIPSVLPKLSNGAQLMLPGVVTQEPGINMYGRHKKMQLVGVNLTNNKAAVGVGFLPLSSEDLYMCGGRGVAVKILHLFGDKLWGHEPSLVQQVPDMKPAELTSDDFPALGSEHIKHKAKPADAPSTFADILAATKIAADVEGNKTHTENESESAKENDNPISGAIEPEAVQDPENAAQETNTPEEILKHAFLTALKHHGKSLQLPLLTSNFYRLYVLPEASESIDIKKTKYKKLSAFLNTMVDEGFIVLREETKGVDKITYIDLEHPELVNFITDYKPPTSTGGADAAEQPLFHSELTELYLVTDATAAFFTKLNYKRGEGIPAKQIKKIVREYISKQNLPIADPITKTIKLDETLKQLMGTTAATSSQIYESILMQMEHSYQMCTLKDVAANKPLIQMSLATRSGNKKVTLVSNVECYGIIVPEFIKLCKQGAAASTTVVKLPNQNREQLQIQGNQVRFIFNLLTETYKVPAKCILGLELAKDGKKHKKK